MLINRWRHMSNIVIIHAGSLVSYSFRNLNAKETQNSSFLAECTKCRSDVAGGSEEQLCLFQ